MTAQLDPALAHRLTERFTKEVMAGAGLPETRSVDVAESLSLGLEPGRLSCTCDITGSTRARHWDGSLEEAEELVDELAEETASLISETPRYAWLRARR